MIIKFNEEAIQRLKGKAKISRNLALTGVLTSSLILSGCNRTMFDTKYGFDKALILGDDSSIILDVEQWRDYSGEQIQLTTSNNFVLLTSSFDTDCFYGDSTNYSIENIAANAIKNNEIHELTNQENNDTIFNADIIDTNWNFNKSITFNGNNALILPIGEWKDYDGEQLQVITNDGLILVLSSYNSKLVSDSNSSISAYEFAQSYVGSDGKVVDLSKNNTSEFNYDLIDFKYEFNKAIIIKDDSCVILPITEWRDYEGEQLQLKIHNGPTIVTAAYDTILLNDINSQTKAIDIAKSLSDNVVDLAANHNEEVYFNRTVVDLNYGYSNAIISNDNSSSALKIDKWTDYEGEQLQIQLDSGDTILTSSIMLDLINGGTSSLNASELAKLYISKKGKNIDKSNGDTSSYKFNEYILDLDQGFQYALKVIDGNVTIIPLKSWKDYYNSDGGEDTPDSPNCEQIQLVLPDGTVILTTMYDTILVNNISDINEIAELFRGQNGVISDLTKYVGEPCNSGWNLSLFDTKFYYNYAILNHNSNTQVIPIQNWLDFSEGEQIQLNFNDDTGVLTSLVNTTLICPKTQGIEEIIANAFSGDLDKSKNLVKIYK